MCKGEKKKPTLKWKRLFWTLRGFVTAKPPCVGSRRVTTLWFLLITTLLCLLRALWARPAAGLVVNMSYGVSECCQLKGNIAMTATTVNTSAKWTTTLLPRIYPAGKCKSYTYNHAHWFVCSCKNCSHPNVHWEGRWFNKSWHMYVQEWGESPCAEVESCSHFTQNKARRKIYA